jgi:hypothetical protein
VTALLAAFVVRPVDPPEIRITPNEVGVVAPVSPSKVVAAPVALTLWKDGSDETPFETSTNPAVEGETPVRAEVDPSKTATVCAV